MTALTRGADGHRADAATRCAAGDPVRTRRGHRARFADRPHPHSGDGVPAFLAKVYERLGRTEEATLARRRCVERAERNLSRNPADVRALYLGATALAGLGERRQAVEWIDRACAIAPDDPVARQYAACVYVRVGQTATALECVEQAIAVGYRHRE